MDAFRSVVAWLFVVVLTTISPRFAPAQTPVDLTKIPDGTPAELLDYINKVDNSPMPQTNSNEEQILHLHKIGNAIAGAAEKILDHPEATDEQIVVALEKRLAALAILERFGDPKAAGITQATIEKYSQDKRPSVVNAIKPFVIQQRIQAAFTPEKQTDDQTALATAGQEGWKELQSLLTKDQKPSAQLVQTALLVISVLKHTKQNELATEACHKSAHFLTDSGDPDWMPYAEEFSSIAEQLEMIGKPINIEGTLVDGQKFDWSKYKGKVVLVDFWATWCPPCVAELPNLRANYEKYHSRGFEVVGISLDDDRAVLEGFLKQNPLPWPVIFSDTPGSGGLEHPMAKRYKVEKIPFILLVDRQGNVVSLEARGEELGRLLAELLPDGKTP